MTRLLIMIMTSVITVHDARGQRLKESQVPAATKVAFEKQYPGIKAGWEKEGANYEVNFKKDGKGMSCVIGKNGTILETETDIPVGGLPQSAQAYVKDHYTGAKIREVSKIVKPGGEVIYEASVNGKDVMFDANGKFIKVAKD